MIGEVGMLIVIEGLDGAGLSTQAALLEEYLSGKNKAVLLTKEPTSSPIGTLIRSALRRNHDVSLIALQLLFAADRAEHLEHVIEPAMRADTIVISDRYILSSLAFGSVDNDLEFLKLINARFRRPDLTVIIDTPPEVCLTRIKKNRDTIELFEEERRLEAVRKQFLALSEYFKHTFVVDGDRAKEQVSRDIQALVEQRLMNP
ncbi:MAG: dTMP kinase [Methanophagales archaeon ANME-1-THS]|nr:MAG: dTMP kinase [Methanophagales archaeon ANME-1-THS]